MGWLERVLIAFFLVLAAIVLLGVMGVIQPYTGFKLASLTMLLTWLVVLLKRVFIFGHRRPLHLQGSTDGEWIPALEGARSGIWITRLSRGEKRRFLTLLQQSDTNEDRATAWAGVCIGWKGHCLNGIDGWKGHSCAKRNELPFSFDNVYSCCLRNPELFAHYASKLRHSIGETGSSVSHG